MQRVIPSSELASPFAALRAGIASVAKDLTTSQGSM
jgi:hypothetical protein